MGWTSPPRVANRTGGPPRRRLRCSAPGHRWRRCRCSPRRPPVSERVRGAMSTASLPPFSKTALCAGRPMTWPACSASTHGFSNSLTKDPAEPSNSRAIGTAAVAHIGADSTAVLAALDGVGSAVTPEWLPTIHWFRSVAYRRNGDLQRGLRRADRRRPPRRHRRRHGPTAAVGTPADGLAGRPRRRSPRRTSSDP